MFPVDHLVRETVATVAATSETLCGTLMPVFSMQAGCIRRHAQLVPDSGEGQPQGTW
jgi:hypothetical protein